MKFAPAALLRSATLVAKQEQSLCVRVLYTQNVRTVPKMKAQESAFSLFDWPEPMT